ncbi:MAG: type III PLP-dependent enzyme [Candidatus Omnitrophica bacterium]|jgi:ornithine decarboxylase|nr:type III PLP-dependent enzyme [Candidatus Omnitrophota bacterium]
MKKDDNGFKQFVTSLVKKHGTPLFLISELKLKERVEYFKKLLPGVVPYYAVKANPSLEILKTFASLGLYFDVASEKEIETILKLGVSPDKLILSNSVKSPPLIKFAKEKNVLLFTFDSEYEIQKIAKYAPGSRVIARIKVPNVGSVVELSLKFGLEPEDVIPLLVKAKKLGLKPEGISFHVGSQCTRVENYLESFELTSMILKDAQAKNISLNIVDIGGGFPIKHFNHEEGIFEEMAPVLNKELHRIFNKSIQIIGEPGRALVGPCCTLVMRVIGKSIRKNKHWYYLDDGVYGCLSGIIYDHCKYQFNVFKKGSVQISTLAGPTCDSFDIISVSEDLPELEIGDIIYVKNIGAYSIATATNFNSIPVAKTIVI